MFDLKLAEILLSRKMVWAAAIVVATVVLGLSLSEPSTSVVYRVLLFSWAALLFASRIVIMEAFGGARALGQTVFDPGVDERRNDIYQRVPPPF